MWKAENFEKPNSFILKSWYFWKAENFDKLKSLKAENFEKLTILKSLKIMKNWQIAKQEENTKM